MRKRVGTGRRFPPSRAVRPKGKLSKSCFGTFTKPLKDAFPWIWSPLRRPEGTGSSKSPYEGAHGKGAVQAAGASRLVHSESSRKPSHLREAWKSGTAFRSGSWKPRLEDRSSQAPPQASRNFGVRDLNIRPAV